MLTVLLILIPLITGLLTFGLKGSGPKVLGLVSSLASLAVVAGALVQFQHAPEALQLSVPWIPQLGARFQVGLDGMGAMLCLLTAIAFLLVFITIYNRNYERAGSFYGLMLLSQAGLVGVFTAYDAMLFYVFWELALIPVYFLCSMWGGEKRIPVTFKFFIYTFTGSLLMLVGIIYLYLQSPDRSFSYAAFTNLNLPAPGAVLVILAAVCGLCHQDADLPLSYLATGYLRAVSHAGNHDPVRGDGENGPLRYRSLAATRAAPGRVHVV